MVFLVYCCDRVCVSVTVCIFFLELDVSGVVLIFEERVIVGGEVGAVR